jgi:hypothetical protein
LAACGVVGGVDRGRREEAGRVRVPAPSSGITGLEFGTLGLIALLNKKRVPARRPRRRGAAPACLQQVVVFA